VRKELSLAATSVTSVFKILLIFVFRLRFVFHKNNMKTKI